MAREWTVRALGDCLSALIDYRGKTPQKADSGIPLITAKVVKGGRIESPNEFIAVEDYEPWMRRGLPKVGDVVITTEAPLGEVAQLRFERVALAQRLIVLRGKPEVLDNAFLKFLMQSEEVQNQLKARASGTTVLGIKQRELRKVLLRLPPLGEQRAIASILGALDDKIELNRQTNVTLEAIAKALFKSWFVDFEPVRAKAADRDASLPGHLTGLFPARFVDSELREIPQGWSAQSFADTVEIVGGGTPPTTVADYWNGDIPWFSVVDAPATTDVWITDTERKITARGLANSSAQMLPVGATIISARGTVGRIGLVGLPMAMNQSCYGLLPRIGADGFFSYFLTRELVSTLQQRAHGSVFDTITRDTLAKVAVVVPPRATVDAFENHVRPVMNRIRLSLVESHTLAVLRDTLLSKLVTGELSVRSAEQSLEQHGG